MGSHRSRTRNYSAGLLAPVMYSITPQRARPARKRGAREPAMETLLRIELLVDHVGDLEELVLADVARGQRVAALAVHPVEHAHPAFLGVAECGLAASCGLSAHVQRDARAFLR